MKNMKNNTKKEQILIVNDITFGQFKNIINHIDDKKIPFLVFGDNGAGKFSTISNALSNKDKQVIICNCINKDEAKIILSKCNNNITLIFDNIDKAPLGVQNECFTKAFERNNSCIFIAESINDFDYTTLNRLMVFDYNKSFK